jgi:hypothetical protein
MYLTFEEWFRDNKKKLKPPWDTTTLAQAFNAAKYDAEASRDGFVNAILANAPEAYDGDAAAEAIAVEYVRDLEWARDEALAVLSSIASIKGIGDLLGSVQPDSRMSTAAAKRKEIAVRTRLEPEDDSDRIEHIHGDGSGCFPGCRSYYIASQWWDEGSRQTGMYLWDKMVRTNQQYYLRIVQALLDKGIIH